MSLPNVVVSVIFNLTMDFTGFKLCLENVSTLLTKTYNIGLVVDRYLNAHMVHIVPLSQDL